MLTPNFFSIQPSSQTGDCYATEFTATAIGIPVDYTKITWDLGNNVFKYNTKTISTSYDYPGIYTIKLSAWNNDGFLITDEAEVNVDYAFRDVLMFTKLPSAYGTPGQPSVSPFVVSLTSAKIKEPLSIVLQSLNTKSVPHYAVPDKWKFITPKWRFVDASSNQILTGPIQLKTEPIYKNSKVVATKGEASFYYIDDLSTGQDLNNSCPLLLIATLSTENFQYPPESLIYPYNSYSNSEVTRAVIAWQINDVIPTKLKVTENFINDIYPVKWTNIPIPVMVTCQFDPGMLQGFEASETQATDVLAYPRTNELGASSPVTLVLSSAEYGILPSDYYQVEQSNLYFTANDASNNSTNGYIFTTITPLCSISSTVVVAASTVATNQLSSQFNQFGFPDGFAIYPDVYVSNPFKSTINKINIVTYPANCENISYYKNLGVLIEGTASSITVPTNQTFELSSYSLSGTAGVYGMAFNPFLNKLYATDADQDTVLVFNSGTTLVSSIQLSSITGYDNNIPSYISIDGDHNVWISLYGHEILLKFNSNLSYLLSAAPPVTLGTFASGSPLVAPPVVETDFDNNVWACYAHPLNSMLFKLSGTDGQFMLSASELSLSSVPVSLSINADNDVWVACRESNRLELYSGTTGTKLSSLENLFYRPSYTAMDRSNNVWFTHGYNFCGVYNVLNNTLSSWKFNSQTNTVTYSPIYTQDDIDIALTENEIWGGISVDVFNRVWVVDSERNTIWTFNPNDPIATARPFVVIPEPDTNYVVIGGTNYISQIADDTVRSAQAAGDWSGNKWYQKYATSIAELGVEGQSTPFTIYDLNDSYQLTKVNEEFNTSEYFKSLAFPEVLSKNTSLFDFLSAVAGNGIPTEEDPGRVSYERIANFINNHGDFETAEIEQLLSLANQLAVEGKTFGTGFPAEVNRLLNLFSTPKHRLRGLPNYEADISLNIGARLVVPENFDGPVYNTITTLSSVTYSLANSADGLAFAIANDVDGQNITFDVSGSDITFTFQLTAESVETTIPMVTAGQYLFMKDRQFDKYQIVYINELSPGVSVYPVTQLEIEGARLPLLDNYYFFEYLEEQSGYKNNIINWDSDFTTVQYQLSTNEQWYGDDGLVEIMFNNLLTKQLFVE